MPSQDLIFTTYSHIKQKLAGMKYKGYDLCKPSAAIIANYLYNPKPTRKKLRDTLKLLWIKPLHSNKKELTGNILAWHTTRSDHKNNAEHICRSLSHSTPPFKMVRIPKITKDYKRTCGINAIWEAWKIIKTARIEKKYLPYVLPALTYSIRYYDSAEEIKITKDIKTLVSYNSSNIPECFLTSACNRDGIKTFSLQHGLYFDFLNTPPLAIINHENVTAKVLLTWSSFCKEQIEQFHQRHTRPIDFEIYIAGYLKGKPKIIKQQSLRHRMILCLLPHECVAASINLLKLLHNLHESHEVTVRIHPLSRSDKLLLSSIPPSFKLDSHELLEESINANQYRLAVGFNTTSLFDTLLFGIPCALFETPESTFRIKHLPNFSNEVQLRNILRTATPTPDIANHLLGSDTFLYQKLING